MDAALSFDRKLVTGEGLGTYSYKLPSITHFCRVGEYLRECRGRGDRRFVDVEILVDGQRDYLHSVLGFLHSRFIKEVMKSQASPLRIKMDGYRAKYVFRVIDWMYYGETELRLREMGEYLAVTAGLGVDVLHERIETRLRQLASSTGCLVPCINIATEIRFQVTPLTRNKLIGYFAKHQNGQSMTDLQMLTLNSVTELLANRNISFNDKVRIINIAIIWLKDIERQKHLDTVLKAIYVPDFAACSLESLKSQLYKQFVHPNVKHHKTLHVYTDDGKSIVVSGDPEKFMSHGGSVVPPVVDLSESQSRDSLNTIEKREKFDLSQLREISKIPNIGSPESILVDTPIKRKTFHEPRNSRNTITPFDKKFSKSVGQKSEIAAFGEGRRATTVKLSSLDNSKNVYDSVNSAEKEFRFGPSSASSFSPTSEVFGGNTSKTIIHGKRDAINQENDYFGSVHQSKVKNNLNAVLYSTDQQRKPERGQGGPSDVVLHIGS